MSTLKRDPSEVRRRLLSEAARILSEGGPAALSARRLAKEAETSTMAVYTHFGSMPELVRALTREGFARFLVRVEAVPRSEDPVAELAELCGVYQAFARVELDVYAVLFGGATLVGFTLTDEDRAMGVDVLRHPRDAIRRCIAAGRFHPDADPDLLVRQLFCQMHGLAQLAHAGYLIGAHGPDQVLAAMTRDFAIAAGDSPDAAVRSVTEGLDRRIS
ncbi:TetR/AcrR family transcriptional regulator [Streptomyces sp. NPDC020755]|uniref:TetR/AcrR family transcriptional regulator n=1 Tax=unclassified Streptomyces TaxID=2593676 RepID=UPI002241BF96|nr:TetR/AcrR family transcriptional regulator [Streptomyces sp. VB1]UZI27466.1 TetR/AcrR family transcriptional regulator [Streptomyces sp. VB1]